MAFALTLLPQKKTGRQALAIGFGVRWVPDRMVEICNEATDERLLPKTVHAEPSIWKVGHGRCFFLVEREVR